MSDNGLVCCTEKRVDRHALVYRPAQTSEEKLQKLQQVFKLQQEFTSQRDCLRATSRPLWRQDGVELRIGGTGSWHGPLDWHSGNHHRALFVITACYVTCDR